MAEELLNPTDLKTIAALLQQAVGFTYPPNLEKEFAYRMASALKRRGYSLPGFIQQVQAGQTPQDKAAVFGPLLPDILIGETYFWREPETFNALRSTVLPDIVARKGTISRLLRVWSAACATGEELYSAAFFLRHYFNGTDWTISLMGSDINKVALETARQGEYGPYSFRGDTPDRTTYLESTAHSNRVRVRDTYRAGIRFQELNLAQSPYPSLETDTCMHDIIFCRNVLMYFPPALIQQIVDRLFDCLIDGGYLIVSPSEYSSVYFQQFEPVTVGQITLYRRPLHSPLKLDPIVLPSQQKRISRPSFVAAMSIKAPSLSAHTIAEMVAQAKTALAEGRLSDADGLCAKAIDLDALYAESYLVLTRLHQETGLLEPALEMARKFAYLEPERVEGHYYLAMLQKALGRPHRAILAFRRVLALLPALDPQHTFEHVPGTSGAHMRQVATENLAALESTRVSN